MQKKKVTQQDIADALQLSRNTVSKVFSNHSSITIKTRQQVLDKAREIGYISLKTTIQDDNTNRPMGSIAIFCHASALSHVFWSRFIPGLEDSISQAGYQFALHIISPDEEKTQRLPNNWQGSDVRGIALSGVFHHDYVRMVSGLGLPLVMFDAVSDFLPPHMVADIITMENTAGIQEIARDLIRKGHRKIGFIGDINNAISIRERWLGFIHACMEAGFEPDKSLSILSPCQNHYYSFSEIDSAIRLMAQFPTAFICAADEIAFHVIRALADKGLKVPDDLAVSGFDNFEEAYMFNPELTSVNCYTSQLGQRVGEAVVRRIHHPDAPFEIIHQNVSVHLRTSTNKTV